MAISIESQASESLRGLASEWLHIDSGDEKPLTNCLVVKNISVSLEEFIMLKKPVELPENLFYHIRVRPPLYSDGEFLRRNHGSSILLY